MIHLNILQQRLCCVGNDHQESCMQTIGKDFQCIYCNGKARRKHVQWDLSVSGLGGHLDGGMWVFFCDALLCFVPWDSSIFDSRSSLFWQTNQKFVLATNSVEKCYTGIAME
jgi:hypothetical protein